VSLSTDGGEVEARAVLGGEHEREERIVRAFEGERAVVPLRFDLARVPRDVGKVSGQQRRVDLHGAEGKHARQTPATGAEPTRAPAPARDVGGGARGARAAVSCQRTGLQQK
jgi:hypothetical protein